MLLGGLTLPLPDGLDGAVLEGRVIVLAGRVVVVDGLVVAVDGLVYEDGGVVAGLVVVVPCFKVPVEGFELSLRL